MSNTTKVTKTTYTNADGRVITQYRTSIPKVIAEEYDLEDAEIEWRTKDGVEIEVIR